MSMIVRTNMKKFTVSLATVLLIASSSLALAAASEAEFKAAYAAAEAANKQAGSLRNQWTTTTAALAAAKKAADSGDFDQAVASSRKPKRWPRLPYFRRRAKKKPGKQSKYASAR